MSHVQVSMAMEKEKKVVKREKHCVQTSSRTAILFLAFQFLAFYNARLLMMGGALTVLVSGLIQKAYGWHNISSKDGEVLIKSLTSSVVDITEAALALIIGMETTVYAFQRKYWSWSVVQGKGAKYLRGF